MENKVIKNESKLDIKNYRIEEAELDQFDKPIVDTNTGRLKWTGKTLEWSIKAGETLEFPAYVADYLISIYDFLKEVKVVPEAKVEKEKPKKAIKKEEGKWPCPHCEKVLDKRVYLGRHIGMKHWDILTE